MRTHGNNRGDAGRVTRAFVRALRELEQARHRAVTGAEVADAMGLPRQRVRAVMRHVLVDGLAVLAAPRDRNVPIETLPLRTPEHR